MIKDAEYLPNYFPAFFDLPNPQINLAKLLESGGSSLAKVSSGCLDYPCAD